MDTIIQVPEDLRELARRLDEVKQPLAAVTMSADASLRWLAESPPNLEELRACLDRIVRDVRQAGDVIARISALMKSRL